MKQLSPAQIVLMRKAGELTKNALLYAETLIKPGISTNSLDKLIEKYIIDHGGIPSFKHYEGYPNSTCISVNEVVVHGETEFGKVEVIGAFINEYNKPCTE